MIRQVENSQDEDEYQMKYHVLPTIEDCDYRSISKYGGLRYAQMIVLAYGTSSTRRDERVIVDSQETNRFNDIQQLRKHRSATRDTLTQTRLSNHQ